MTLQDKAFLAFNYGTLAGDMRTDFQTCDLHEQIAGKRYSIYDTDDDPIYTITNSFTNSECRKFIKGVIEIMKDNPITLDAWIEQETE